jgi:hypothetical protein
MIGQRSHATPLPIKSPFAWPATALIGRCKGDPLRVNARSRRQTSATRPSTAHALQPMADRGDREFGRVGVDPDAHPAFVVGHRDNRAFAKRTVTKPRSPSQVKSRLSGFPPRKATDLQKKSLLSKRRRTEGLEHSRNCRFPHCDRTCQSGDYHHRALKARAGGKDHEIKAAWSKVSTTWQVAGAERLLAVREASIRAQIHGGANLRQFNLLKRYLVSTTHDFRKPVVVKTRLFPLPVPKFAAYRLEIRARFKETSANK